VDFSTVCYEIYKTAAASHEIIADLGGGGGLGHSCTGVPGARILFADGSLPDLGDGRPIGLGGVLAGGELSGEEDGLNMIYRTQGTVWEG
jgi:hypothetical protein